jgi:hypothetical protein
MAAWNLDHTVHCCIPQETTLVLVKVDLIDSSQKYYFLILFLVLQKKYFCDRRSGFIQKKDEQLENSEQQSAARCGAVTIMVGPVYERSIEHSIA